MELETYLTLVAEEVVTMEAVAVEQDPQGAGDRAIVTD